MTLSPLQGVGLEREADSGSWAYLPGKIPQEERDVEGVPTVAGHSEVGSGERQRIHVPGSLPGPSPCASPPPCHAGRTACGAPPLPGGTGSSPSLPLEVLYASTVQSGSASWNREVSASAAVGVAATRSRSCVDGASLPRVNAGAGS